ncbi:hypothetical protein GCM10023322_68740 [Rugosimonospora acidiphila]|uniref:Uncharacterized protein n=2 Tax=Rugosimonospora acidiphila TaxID=556531 RepID=A0ABP9SLQ6_9ACTN
MDNYHEYHVEVIEPDGTRKTLLVDVHEDHHNAHGFDGNGNLKNASAFTGIIANAIGISKDVINAFKYLGKVKRR